jgi:hypothetical protein
VIVTKDTAINLILSDLSTMFINFIIRQAEMDILVNTVRIPYAQQENVV